MSKFIFNKEQVASVFEAHPEENTLIIASDGNIFLPRNASFARNHCLTFKLDLAELTREEFATKKADKVVDTTDWKAGKFMEIVAFAESKGLKAKTKTNKGTPALIHEVEAYLNTLEVPTDETPEVEASEVTEGNESDDYTPVGEGDESKTAE